MIITCTSFHRFFFHLPNKPGWDFQKCLKCFASTNLRLPSQNQDVFKSPRGFQVLWAQLHFWVLLVFAYWTQQLLLVSKMDSKTSCLHYVRSKIVHRGQSTRSDLGKMSVQHLLQPWLLMSLFEGLLQPSYVDFFSVEAHKSAFLCVLLPKVLEDIWHVQVSVQTNF